METPAITLARRAYSEAGKLLDYRTAERETAKRALRDAVAQMNAADERWDAAASTVDKTFQVLRDLVAEMRASEDDPPPEYEPGDAEAQRIADVFADARAEQDRGL